MARHASMLVVPCRPWSAAACLLALLPVAAALSGAAPREFDDSCALVQLEMFAAEPDRQTVGHLVPEPKVVSLRDQFDAEDDHVKGKVQGNVLQFLNSTGKMAWVTQLLKSLNSQTISGQPIDFSALMSNPKIINGLLTGDLTKAIIDLANEQKAPLSNDFRTSDMLQGHTVFYNNVAVVVVLACVCVMPMIGEQLDRRAAAAGRAKTERRFSNRIAFLLLASYAIWIPAIFSADFSFNIGFIVPVTGQRVGITQDEHHDHRPGPIHESTRTLVHLLWSTRAHAGAVLIAIYAFAVPALKLVLLAVAELFRFSDQTRLRQLSRSCILMMQFISKWAAPDMFAYVLLYYLIRRLEHLPVSTLCLFDIGFTCYSVFSITCAISSLGIPLPQVEQAQPEEVKPPLALRLLDNKKERLPRLACSLASVWALLFVAGLFVPCFALRLDAELLKDHVPDSMKQVLRMIKLNQIIFPQDVSLWRSMWSMLYWFVTDKDLNLFLAFLMLSVFAISLTAVSMANLLKAAWQLSKDAPCSTHPCPAMAKSEVLKHLSMLDVMLMGVLVGTLAGGIYRDEGIVIYIRHGIFVVMAAEAMHYLTYYAVRSVAEYEVKVAEIQVKKILGDDGEKGKVAS